LIISSRDDDLGDCFAVGDDRGLEAVLAGLRQREWIIDFDVPAVAMDLEAQPETMARKSA
jgi:hypothetical protein